jgi:type II secretory pathway component GspD/PulD (secretin)
MWRTNLSLILVSLIVALGIGLTAAPGQENERPKRARPVQPGKSKRIAYVVQHGSAKELADLLGKHFKGEAEIQVLSSTPSDCLLINARTAVFDEVLKLLALHDRRRQTVAIEVLIAEFERNIKDDSKKEAEVTDVDAGQFKGPAAQVVANLEALLRKGQIGTLRRLQLTLVEGQPSAVLIGQSKPFVMGLTRTGTGVVSRSISYRNLGTQLRATAHIGPDNKIEIELDLSDSRAASDDAVVIGKDESGAAVRATDFVNSKFTSKLRLGSGQALAAEGVQTTSKSGRQQTLVVVAATIVDPSVAAEKDGPASKRPRKRIRPEER